MRTSRHKERGPVPAEEFEAVVVGTVVRLGEEPGACTAAALAAALPEESYLGEGDAPFGRQDARLVLSELARAGSIERLAHGRYKGV
ncbi:MAG: hypothetical protein WD749_02855 [Phycisphaerales bacterium]